MNFEALFQQQAALSSLPKVVQEVIESFNHDNVSIEDIARKLSADQVLSAKLLRLANSSYYHVSRSIGTVDDAVLMLGFMTVRTLVVSTSLTGSFKAMSGVDLKLFWRYSLHTAVVAKWLTKKQQCNSDLAFTVGMMHAPSVSWSCMRPCPNRLCRSTRSLPCSMWRARAEENKYSREEMEFTFPEDVAAKLGVKPSLLLDDMPPLVELSAGMEELIA